jgi:hypothetical protein
MNVSSVCSASGGNQTQIQNVFQQRAQDLKLLGKALKTGDLTGAQKALDTFQQHFQTGSNASTEGSQPFSQNTRAATDLQSLQSALQAGDLPTAQEAFASLKTDLHGVGHAHRGHHQHHRAETKSDGAVDGAAPGADESTTPTETIGGTLDAQA